MTALTTTRRRMPALGALLATLALGSLGACVSPQQDDPHDSTGYLPGTGLDAVQPADIAVMPVELRLLDPSGAEGIPVDDLRVALYEGLIERLYSPLAFDWVEAGGASDAALEVAVLGWDTANLAYDGTVVARAEASMVRGGEVLWAVELTRRLNDDVGGAQRSDSTASIDSSIGELAREILALLPERDPLAAR